MDDWNTLLMNELPRVFPFTLTGHPFEVREVQAIKPTLELSFFVLSSIDKHVVRDYRSHMVLSGNVHPSILNLLPVHCRCIEDKEVIQSVPQLGLSVIGLLSTEDNDQILIGYSRMVKSGRRLEPILDDLLRLLPPESLGMKDLYISMELLAESSK